MVDSGLGQELKEKLPTLPPSAVKTVAARAALQKLPHHFALLKQGYDYNDREKLLLASLRATIVSGIEGIRPNQEVTEANTHVIAGLKAAYTDEVLSGIPKSAVLAYYAVFDATRDADEIITAFPSNFLAYDFEGLNERTADTDALTTSPTNTEQVFATSLWYGKPPEPHASLSQQFFENAPGTPWEFWAEWYEGMLIGNPMDWGLQRRVALIDEDVWSAGPDAVAAEIEQVRKELEQRRQNVREPIEPTKVEKSLVKKSVVQNRDAIAVSAAGLIEQLKAFREKIRGMNSLEVGLRSEILAFTDYFHQHLQQLLQSLPPPNDDLSEDLTRRIALWFRDYRDVLRTKLAHYSSPENMAEATVPTGIVLTATGIGAMLGQPLAGAAVGGLITNQMKSSQAAKELLKPTDAGEASDK